LCSFSGATKEFQLEESAGRHCTTLSLSRHRSAYNILFGKCGKENLGVKRRVVLKRMLKHQQVEIWMGYIWLKNYWKDIVKPVRNFKVL
jgi:hypothetical protein